MILEEKQLFKVSNENNRKSVGKNIVFPPNYSPNNNVGSSIGGGNNSSKQAVLGTTIGILEPMRIRAWHCHIIEKNANRERIVVVSKDAVINQKYGWICNCGNWTFGDDMYHTPHYGLVKKRKEVCYR